MASPALHLAFSNWKSFRGGGVKGGEQPCSLAKWHYAKSIERRLLKGKVILLIDALIQQI